MRYQKVILLNYRFIFNQQYRIITLLQKLLFPTSLLKSILLFFNTIQFCSNQCLIMFQNVMFLWLKISKTYFELKFITQLKKIKLSTIITVYPRTHDVLSHRRPCSQRLHYSWQSFELAQH